MVFESLLVDILNRYLRPYVKQLDTSQLKVGVWKGRAKLEKLELKEELFTQLDLDVPLKIKKSYIGQLELFIPWKRLTKDPLIVKIEDVYAIVTPDLSVHYDVEAERTRLMKEKTKKIKKLKEATNKLKKKDKDAKKQEKKKKKKKDDDEEDTKPDTFTEKLITNLLKNLIVQVSRIHVRYEDPVTNVGTKFSVGVTLDNLELKSTDANWTVQSAVKEATTLVYKLLELKALGVYWEAPAPMLLDLEDTWIKEMKERIFLKSSPNNLIAQYVLWPVSATAKLTLSVKQGVVDLNTPQVQVGVDCDTIALAVREEQFKSALESMETYEWYNLNRQFWKYKPSCPLVEDKRAWWKYAFNAVLEDVRRRLHAWSWVHIKAHRELCRLYQKKYKEKVHSVSVSSSLKQELEGLEEKLDVSNIMICRKLAKQGKQKPSPKELPPAELKSPMTPVAQPQPPPITPTVPITAVFTPPIPTNSSPSSSTPSAPPPTPLVTTTTVTPPHPMDTSVEQAPPKPKPPSTVLVPRPSLGELTTAKGEPPPAKPARPSGRVVVETLSVQKKKEKEEKGGFFANLKKKFKTGSDDTPPPKGPPPPVAVQTPSGPPVKPPPPSTKVQTESEKASPKKGPAEGASLQSPMGTKEPLDVEVVTERDPEQEEKERREFMLAIGYSEDMELEDLPKEYVAQKIVVNLKTVKLDLIGQTQCMLAQFTATNIGANVALRPSAEGVSVLAGIGSIELTGVPKGDQKTVMVSSCTGSEVGTKLIDLALEINPLNSDKDVIVKASLQPISIIYDAPTVDGLIRALLVRKVINLQEISAAASSGLNELKEQTKARLKDALASRKKTDLDITLHSPYIIVPESGVYSEGSRLIVVTLGEVMVKTLNVKEASKDADDVSKYYDKFLLKLQRMQVLLAKPGDDWLAACKESTSSLHIVDPTGFEIALEQKIGSADPYLPSTRVKGTLKRFEVKLSDDKLASLISIAMGFPIPPIQDTTTYYNQVGLPPTARLLDELYVEPDDETVSLSSVQLGQQDSDQDGSETSSLTSFSTSDSNPEKLRQVFINALIDLTVEKLRLELTKYKAGTGLEEEEPLFYVDVSNLGAHVTDGKFDTQGTISMGGVTVLDYITKGPLGRPTQLLKTKSLQDGNFVTVNFATISAVGEAYAKVYSGLKNSVLVQASGVEMVVNRTTITGVMSLAKSIAPQKRSSKSTAATEAATTGSADIMATGTSTKTTTNSTSDKDFFFDVKLEGVSLALDDCEKKVLATLVKGFEVSGSIQNNQTHVVASMEDLMLQDTSPGAQVYELVTKTDSSKKMIALEVTDYHKKAQRNPSNLRLCDVALSAVIQRVSTTLSPPFLANVMEFVQHLQLDTSDLRNAAKATATTAVVTADAIRESAARVRLDVSLHAPLLRVPYKTRHGEGNIVVDLGDFKLSNSFVSGADVMAERGLFPLSTNSDAKAILDKMVIQTTAIEVYRLHDRGKSSASLQAERSAILEPVGFTACIVRNLTPQVVYFPKADISLNLGVVKFSTSDQDVEALATVGLATSKVSDVINSISAQQNAEAAIQEVHPKNSEANVATTDEALSNVKDVSVHFSMKMVVLHVHTAEIQLLRATASDIAAYVDVFPSHLTLSASVKDVSILDTYDTANHSSIVSQVNSSDSASSVKLKLYLKQRGALDPLGELVARISQLRLVVPLPFIIRLADFAQKIQIQPDLITNAAKVAKDGAKVVQAAAYDHYDKYVLVNVTVAAPLVFVPLVGAMPQALVVNFGDLNIRNQLTTPQPSVTMDTYSMTLTHFKVSRVLVDLKAPKLDVKAERILLHPFSISVMLDHNLTAGRDELPSFGIKLTMSELNIHLGQEEFEVMVATGLDISNKVADLIPKANVGEVTGAIHQGLTTPGSVQVAEHKASTVYTVVSVTSTLEKFQLKLFSEEPHLTSGVKDSMDIPDSCSLTTFQMVGMVLSTSVSSNQNVDLRASMMDVTLFDDQGRRKNKKIGDRMIQHYTKNPLVAYTGVSANPIVKIGYHLSGDTHSVNLGMDQLLILSDLDFIFAMKDYFTKVADYAKAKAAENRNYPKDRAVQSSASATSLVPSKENQASAKALPKIKVLADVRNFCVAIVESGDAEEPQALQLKLSSYFNFQLNETEKKGFFNILNLSIATSSFTDLDTTSSWVLLPTSLMISMHGPLVGSAISIDGRLEPVKITLSHPIVLLIIHAIKNLVPEKKVVKVKPSNDLWLPKNLSDMKLWFLSETHHETALQPQTIQPKSEYFDLEVVSVELILESESTQKSDGIPILAVNLSASVKISEWTGQLSVEGDIQCEASYYNECQSLWEPLLEPLEDKKGENLYPWTIQIKAKKSLPSGAEGKQEDPKFALSLQSTYPLQLTLTVTSLHIIKDLVTAYTKEYGKKLFGSVNIQSLTGAPFTFVNKLGAGLLATIKPGPLLKLPNGAQSARLSAREPVNMQLVKFSAQKSSASVIVQASEPDITVVITVDSYKGVDNVIVNKPGQYYYTLEPNDQTVLPCGLVVDVSVTGVKKTITLRSSIQIRNSCSVKMDLLFLKSKGGYQRVTSIDPDDIYSIPMEAAYEHLFFVLPTGKNMQPVEGSEGFAWYGCDDPPDKFRHSIECSPADDDTISNYINVTCKQEQYKNQKQCPSGSFAHHIFQLHPPAVLQSLLPFPISVQLEAEGSTLYYLEPGSWAELYDVNLIKEPMINFFFSDGSKGKLKLSRQSSEYSTFTVGKENTFTEVNVYTEKMGYDKISVYCPYWMVNKTGLTLEYKEGSRVVRHPPDKAIQVFSSGPKSKIQLAAITTLGTHTEWSKSFPIISVGSSDSISAKLKETTFQFGVEVHLSQFTLSKIVTLTPYYLIVNHTEFDIKIQEAECPSIVCTSAPPGEVTHFWPACDSTRIHVAVNVEHGDSTGYSCPFNYKKSDFLVLQLNEPAVALCVEVQETGSSNVITFSNYYPGCLPVLVINHFPDIALQFGQGAKSPRCCPWLLQPQQAVYYTWDDPTDFHYLIRWQLVDAVAKVSHPTITKVDITKDGGQSYTIKQNPIKAGSPSSPTSGLGSWNPEGSIVSATSSASNEDEDTDFSIGRKKQSDSSRKGYWRCFSIGLQKVLLFTDDPKVYERIKMEGSNSVPLLELSLSMKAIGLSLVDDTQKRELAYVALMESGVIWQVKKGKKENWKTLSTSMNQELEEAYQGGKQDIRQKHLVANLADRDNMVMAEPSNGPLRRTHHEGLYFKFTMSSKDYTMHAKVGYLQVDNQLPFSVYPQLLYPIPPPPTVATSTEPKPLFEASVVLNRADQDNTQSTNTVKHLKYVHVLIQKMAVNADLGFILALVDFFSFKSYDPSFEKEYVKNDVMTYEKSLREIMMTGNTEEFSRLFLDVFHIAPIKVTLSFNIRSVGRNDQQKKSVGNQFVQLFIHSVGIILTSVQEAEIKFSFFHLEYQPQSQKRLVSLFTKHYITQALFQLHTLIFGLDALGSPITVVRGLAEGTFDLFYEPIKGSVLGPEEFLQGLGIGLKSFVGGTVGGLTGAGAKITGAVGDVFAKLTFDDHFIDKRQQDKTKSTKLGHKLGGFAMNLFEGVTGVVTQPVKGFEKEGAIGLLKGTGKGLVGLLVRPAGGLFDLTSGTLHLVTKKTKVGDVEIEEVRPPRFIGRDGAIRPFNGNKALGQAILVTTDDGKYVDTDYLVGHLDITDKKTKILLVTDRHLMLVEPRIVKEGWDCIASVHFKHFRSVATVNASTVLLVLKEAANTKHKIKDIPLPTRAIAEVACALVNKGYLEFSFDLRERVY